MEYFLSLYRGRINRRNFVFGILSSTSTLLIVLFFILYPIQSYFFDNDAPSGFGIALMAFLIFILLFNISLFVRRWHDLGNSGYMVLLNFIPLINIIAVGIVMFKSGQTTKNQYGPTPNESISYPQDILALPSHNDFNHLKTDKKSTIKQDDISMLEKLAQLKKRGVITEEEFKRKKEQILQI